MPEKKYIICQGRRPLTPALPEKIADMEMHRLSEWFSGLSKVEASGIPTERQVKSYLIY